MKSAGLGESLQPIGLAYKLTVWSIAKGGSAKSHPVICWIVMTFRNIF